MTKRHLGTLDMIERSRSIAQLEKDIYRDERLTRIRRADIEEHRKAIAKCEKAIRIYEPRLERMNKRLQKLRSEYATLKFVREHQEREQ